jgi:hypothetical protein
MPFAWWKRRAPVPDALFQPPKETLERRDSIDRELERDKKNRVKQIAGSALSAFSLLSGVNPIGGPDMDLWHGQDHYGGR